MNPDAGPEGRLEELGITLPVPPKPVALYDPVVLSGPWLWISGQLPVDADGLRHTGKVGGELDVTQGEEAARLCALNAVSQARSFLGSLDRVSRCVQLAVFVNSAPGFTAQPSVANGASQCLVDIFGESGRHSRVAVGVSELPLNAAVEISLVLEVVGGPSR